jgi:hypothetical protein
LDVVELKEKTGLAARIGDSLGPAGTEVFATLGTFANDEQKHAVALTAMHLFAGMPDPIGQQVQVTSPAGYFTPGAPVIGRLTAGTRVGVDAAKILLDTAAVPSWEVAGHMVQGWRSVVLPADKNRPVWTAGAISGVQSGTIDYALNSYQPLGLGRVLFVNIPTARGDSGAALFDSDTYVLGLLVGQVDVENPSSPRIFCDIGEVLLNLTCDIPTR